MKVNKTTIQRLKRREHVNTTHEIHALYCNHYFKVEVFRDGSTNKTPELVRVKRLWKNCSGPQEETIDICVEDAYHLMMLIQYALECEERNAIEEETE